MGVDFEKDSQMFQVVLGLKINLSKNMAVGVGCHMEVVSL